MEYTRELGELETYYSEQMELNVQNGKIHAQIWRIGLNAKQNNAQTSAPNQDSSSALKRLRTELRENKVRIRTLDYLIKMKHQEIIGIP